MSKLFQLYAKIFASPFFYRFNNFLFRCSLRGLGILNYYNDNLSGERFFTEKILPKYVSKEPVFFDVGANVGNYLKMLKSYFPNASLHAFEPHPKNFQVISNDEIFSDIHLNNFAVSDTVGSLELFDYKEKDGSSHASTYKEVIEGLHGEKAISHIVKKDTIDNYLSTLNINNIDLMKIDVEGHELKVLQGAKKTIDSNMIRIIHFEFNEMNVEARTYMIDFLKILNDYLFYRMLPKSLLPIFKYQPLTHEVFAYQNIVAIHKDIDK